MARFFLADLFPNAGRLLYLDNDIVVTCCLEEIFYTDFTAPDGRDVIAGIVLDDLKWATSTQFYRHYNRTHPLVVKNVRRGRGVDAIARRQRISSSSSKAERHAAASKLRLADTEVSADEFMDALPKYPNDGVLLIDVKLWRKHNILPLMNEIAEANGRGEYVVSMGTQQFTVLALHDRWKELTPRANLRHFPDMARGFLMWYLYNGIVHFAGQSKPQHICDANSALDHRAVTYHAWALNVDYLAAGKSCSKIIPNNTRKCGEMHIPRADTLDKFHLLVRNAAKAGRSGGEGSLYMRIGGLFNWPQASAAAVISNGDPIARFDLDILHNSSWSWRVFDSDTTRSKRSEKTLSEFWTQAATSSPKRTWLVVNDKICDGTDALDFKTGQVIARRGRGSEGEEGYTLIDTGGNIDDPDSLVSTTGLKSPCLSILTSIKQEKTKPKKAHWDVVAIAIDVLPSPGRELASSLGTLRSLQLEFMRPKFILVRLGPAHEVPVAKRFLQRHGYSVYTAVGGGGAGGKVGGVAGGQGKGNIVYAYRINQLGG
jgi:lipopolysaccharide biosynthesis glycosyltransferase